MNKLAFLIAFFCVSTAFSQTALRKKLIGHWSMTDIKLVDGSKIYDPDILQVRFDLRFLSSDSVQVVFNGKASQFKYTLQDSVITWAGTPMRIRKASDVALEFDQVNKTENQEPLKLTFVSKKINDLGFTPKSYKAKNGEEVFIFEPGRIEPYFTDITRSPVEFIVEKFDFSEFRRGGFVVRFVVTKTGEVTGIRVVASSGEKYDKKLVSAVAQTKGKWIPAEYLGNKVAVEMEYNLNLGWTDENLGNQGAMIDSVSFSNDYFNTGQSYFDYKQYRLAEQNYTKAISYNPLNIDAYYQRAATYILLRKTDEACKDYEQLIHLDQVKAKGLYDRFCKSSKARN